ncbi:MAG: VWA domain-containing protein [Cryomorphaceae bacterium]|nr:VWA domain-containing protein [Flavobacteriales bacterium]
MKEKKATYRLGAILWAAAVLEILFWIGFAVVFLVVANALPGLKWNNPKLGWLFLLGPLMFLVFILNTWAKNRRLVKFSDPKLLHTLIPDISNFNVTAKYILWRLAASFLILALINPQLGSKMSEAKLKGIDLMIALDVSNSMKAEDIKPNRLERAKRSIEKLLGRLHGDRVGIIVFAGQSFVQLPITNDYGAGKLFLSSIDSDIVPVQGTAMGSAIELAMESFDMESPAQKAIIVISDGENHEDDPVAAAQEAAEAGIKVYTIGMGSPDGTPLPDYKGKQKLGFKKDRQGNVVITKLDESVLKEVAAVGNGSYVRASTSEVGLRPLFDELNSIEKTEMGTVAYAEYEDRFQIFLALALFCLLIEFLIRPRKGKFAKSVKIFD